VPECAHDGVGCCKWQSFRNDADGIYGIPIVQKEVDQLSFRQSKSGWEEKLNIPNTHELDLHIHRERFLEFGRLLPSNTVPARVHLVRKWDLLKIAGGQQANLVQHPSEAAGVQQYPTLEFPDLFYWELFLTFEQYMLLGKILPIVGGQNLLVSNMHEEEIYRRCKFYLQFCLRFQRLSQCKVD
jgi:hypothetical protein